MVWDNCSIKLSTNSSGIFYTGDIVTGTVTLLFDKRRKIEELTLQVICNYKAQWTRSKPVIPFVQFYSENKILFEEKFDIFQDIVGTRASSGVDIRNFYFTIPQDLPSSFKDNIAKVTYYVEIVGKSPCKLSKRLKLHFTVYETVHLNQDAKFLTPTFFEFKKDFWNSGHLILSCKTYTGFSPHQIVPLEVTIFNEDRVYVNNCIVSLIQKLTYNTTSGYANEQNFILKTTTKLKSHEEKETFKIDLQIPDCLPSSKSSNPVIEISYSYKIELTFLFHFSLYEEIAVKVASVPVLHYDYDD